MRERDLDTCLVALYVIVDDLYQSPITPCLPPCGGPPARMSASEVLCLGLAAQWRHGVPWKSARGIMRYVRKPLRHVFPTVLTQGAFHRRLWGGFTRLQNAVADHWGTARMLSWMASPFPSPPVPGRSLRGGWRTSPGVAQGAMTALAMVYA